MFQDVGNNTYTCLRTLNSDENSIYCYFIDSEDFVEVYDLSGDPYQLENKAATVSPELLVERKNMIDRAKSSRPPRVDSSWSQWLDTVLSKISLSLV